MCKMIDAYKREVARLLSPFSKEIKDIIFSTPEEEWFWRKLSWATTPLSVLYRYNNCVEDVFDIKEHTPACHGFGDGYFSVTYSGNTEYYYAFYKEDDNNWLDGDVKRIVIREFSVIAHMKTGRLVEVFQGKKEIALEYMKNYHNDWCIDKWIIPCLWKVGNKWYSNLHDADVAARALEMSIEHIKDL